MSADTKFLVSSGLLLLTITLIAFFGWLRRHHAEADDDAAEEELAEIAERRYRQKFARTPPGGLRLVESRPMKEKKGWGSKP